MSKFSSSKLFALFLAALTVFFWGITFVCTKYLLKSFSALEILFIRFVVAYFGLWLMRPKWEKIQWRDNIYFALAGLTGVVLYQFAENIAIDFTSASNVSVIVSICPMFTAITSQIFLKRKHITTHFVLGFLIAIIGVTLVSLNGSTTLHFNPLGDFLALFAAICWGFYSLFVSIINAKKYDAICSTRRVFFFAVILMIPLMIFGHLYTSGEGGIKADGFSESVFVNLSAKMNVARFSNPMNWLNLFFLGLVASGFCFAAWNKACNVLGTVKVSAGIYLIPVVTILFAFFALGEKITIMGAAGALITIAGLFISEKK